MSWEISEFDMGGYLAYYVAVGAIDGELKTLIDQHIVDVCYADSYFSIQDAKNSLKSFMMSDDENRKKGAIAEFLVHVFMKNKGYKQKCLGLNLEERSPKKGFDGVYLDVNDSLWYMESKSGSNKSSTHKDKVEEAYRDLKKKFAGVTDNNPWRNALNHAKVVGTDDNILNVFRKYTSEYDENIYHNVEEFNVIPCGTLYMDQDSKYVPEKVIADVDGYFSKKKQVGLSVICMTQQTIEEFEKYLDS